MRESNLGKLRAWQDDALFGLTESFDHGSDHFFANVCPGGGKTTFGCNAFDEAKKAGLVDVVIFLSPSKRVQNQWALGMSEMGYRVREVKAANVLAEASQFIEMPDGVVGYSITWSMLPKVSEYIAKICENHRVMFMGDEIHHAGHDENGNLSWGEATVHAFDKAVMKIGLSGTLFRSDNARIPFLSYEDEVSDADFNFDYGAGLKGEYEYTHGNRKGEVVQTDPVVRYAFFHRVGGYVEVDNGLPELSVLDFSDTNIDGDLRLLNMRLSKSLEFGSGIVQEMLTQAHERLCDLREKTGYHYGGLLLAKNQNEAELYREWIENSLTDEAGNPVRAITSTGELDPDNAALEEFESTDAHWLISVKKVAEGVDVPRLRVLVYASNYTERLFFTQAFGRVIRLVQGIDYKDQDSAFVWIPDDFRLREIVRNIQDMILHVLPELPSPPSLSKDCPSCGIELPRGASACPACGHEFGGGDGGRFTPHAVGGQGVWSGMTSASGLDYDAEDLEEAKGKSYGVAWMDNLSIEQKAEIEKVVRGVVG
jgi:superfamily II DNA or RNA helicase